VCAEPPLLEEWRQLGQSNRAVGLSAETGFRFSCAAERRAALLRAVRLSCVWWFCAVGRLRRCAAD
jgi:hypothetical protein